MTGSASYKFMIDNDCVVFTLALLQCEKNHLISLYLLCFQQFYRFIVFIYWILRASSRLSSPGLVVNIFYDWTLCVCITRNFLNYDNSVDLTKYNLRWLPEIFVQSPAAFFLTSAVIRWIRGVWNCGKEFLSARRSPHGHDQFGFISIVIKFKYQELDARHTCRNVLSKTSAHFHSSVGAVIPVTLLLERCA